MIFPKLKQVVVTALALALFLTSPVWADDLERNVERLGHTYKDMALDRGDANLCKEECLKDPRCLSFTYYRPGLRGKQARCHLKDKETTPRSKAGCISWVRGVETVATPADITSPPPGKTTMERNVERLGRNYKIKHLDQNDPVSCSQECLRDPQCMAFTFYRQGLKGKKAQCHLKNAVPEAKSKAGCYSGVKKP